MPTADLLVQNLQGWEFGNSHFLTSISECFLCALTFENGYLNNLLSPRQTSNKPEGHKTGINIPSNPPWLGFVHAIVHWHQAKTQGSSPFKITAAELANSQHYYITWSSPSRKTDLLKNVCFTELLRISNNQSTARLPTGNLQINKSNHH